MSLLFSPLATSLVLLVDGTINRFENVASKSNDNEA